MFEDAAMIKFINFISSFTENQILQLVYKLEYI